MSKESGATAGLREPKSIRWRVLGFAAFAIAILLFCLFKGWVGANVRAITFTVPGAFYAVSWRTVIGLTLALSFVWALTCEWPGRLKSIRGGHLYAKALLAAAVAAVLWILAPDWPFVLSVTGILAALAHLFGQKALSLLDAFLLSAARRPLWACLLFALAFTAVFGTNRVMFGGGPYTLDCHARFFHASILNSGRWYLPAPADWEGMQNGTATVVANGRWYSQYLPGSVLLNLLGLKIGSVPVVFALLAAGLVGFTYLCGRRLYGHPTALLGAFLLLVSPMFLLLSATFMEHMPAAFFLTGALWFGLRDLEKPTAWNSLAMGFFIGYACITRPLTTLAVAGPLLIVWAFLVIRRWRTRWPFWALAFLAWLAPMGFLLFFNAKTTGHPFLTGYKAADSVRHSLGFTAANGHTPWVGFINELYNVHALSHWLFEWPVTSYLFIFLLFVLRKFGRRDTVLLLPYLGLLFAYFFYNYTMIDLTPRFVWECIPFLALLSARGIVESAAALRESHLRLSARTTRLALALGLIAFISYAPRAIGGRFAAFQVDSVSGIRGLDPKMIPFEANTKASVFVISPYSYRGLLHSMRCFGGAEFFSNPSEEKRRAYMARHPEREFYCLRWPMTRDRPVAQKLALPNLPRPAPQKQNPGKSRGA